MQSEIDNFLATIVIIKSSCLHVHVVQFCNAKRLFLSIFQGMFTSEDFR
jgi:hypothetical protein